MTWILYVLGAVGFFILLVVCHEYPFITFLLIGGTGAGLAYFGIEINPEDQESLLTIIGQGVAAAWGLGFVLRILGGWADIGEAVGRKLRE